MSRIPNIQSGITRYFDGPLPYETKKQWIRQGTDMRVYVRNCPVAIDGKWFLSIVIANIEVAGHLRGQGYYRDFEAWLEGFAASHHYIQLIYYEHVINRDLARMLQKHNYTLHSRYAAAKCDDDPRGDYYKWVKAVPSAYDIRLCEIEKFLSRNKSPKAELNLP